MPSEIGLVTNLSKCVIYDMYRKAETTFAQLVWLPLAGYFEALYIRIGGTLPSELSVLVICLAHAFVSRHSASHGCCSCREACDEGIVFGRNVPNDTWLLLVRI